MPRRTAKRSHTLMYHIVVTFTRTENKLVPGQTNPQGCKLKRAQKRPYVNGP